MKSKADLKVSFYLYDVNLRNNVTVDDAFGDCS